MKLRTVKNVSCSGQRVLVRTGFDVPIKSGRVLDIGRLEAAGPTLKYLIKRQARLIIASHQGRPDGKFLAALSLRPIIKVIERLLNRPVIFAKRCVGVQTRKMVSQLVPGEVMLLENLRFEPGETANDPSFARQLAGLCDIYVNEAFPNCHRNHASMTGLAKLVPAYAGFQVEQEVFQLSKLLASPAKPFVVIIGGAKVEDKASVIDRLKSKADWVLVGGKTALEINQRGLYRADKNVLVADDFVLDESGVKLDISRKVVDWFTPKILKAQTIFWNGNLGKTEDARFRAGSETIGALVANSSAVSVIGGGDTANLVRELGIARKMTFISTGGGATTQFLATGGRLPGLEPLYR